MHFDTIMADLEWPWQYSFPPFFTIQPHAETKSKQLAAWRSLILDYHKATKQTTLDVTEAQRSPLFNNPAINRKLSLEDIIYVLDNLATKGNAAPINKTKTKWEIYWHSLIEWGNIVYTWATNNGMNNTVCTLFELTDGENSVNEEFHGLDVNVLTKALQMLELDKKCELISFDENQGVKFF